MSKAGKVNITRRMTDNIIAFAPRQPAKTMHGLATPATVLSDQNTADDPPCAANLFYVHSRSLLALPFVTLPLKECKDWGEFWRRTTMWNDEPRGRGHGDYSRGRQYAREAVAAINSDGAQSHGLKMVIDAILERSFSRRGPGGRLCRQLSSAEEGFLHEICKVAVEKHQAALAGQS